MDKDCAQYYADLVEEINQDLYEMACPKGLGLSKIEDFILGNCPLSYKTNGLCHSISFFDIQIWCSENDKRPWVDEDDKPELSDYMPLREWVEMEIIGVLNIMENLKGVAKAIFNKGK